MIANNPNENSYSPFERIEVLEQQVDDLQEAVETALKVCQNQLGLFETLHKQVGSNAELLKKLCKLLEG